MAYAFIFFLALLADQLSKALAAGLNFDNIQLIPGLLGLDFTYNPGIAYGSFGDAEWLQPVVIALTCVAIVAFLIALIKVGKGRKCLRTGIVLIMVGAAGNLIDRLVEQQVRDFILVSVGNIGFLNFNCNVADIAITVGAVLFLLALLFVDKDALFRFRKQKKQEEQAVLEAVADLEERAAETDQRPRSRRARRQKDGMNAERIVAESGAARLDVVSLRTAEHHPFGGEKAHR